MKKEKQHIIDLIYQLDFENAAKHLFQLSKEEQISLMVFHTSTILKLASQP